MKYAWIDEHRGQYTVSQLCCVLGVSRSGYCQWRVRPPQQEGAGQPVPGCQGGGHPPGQPPKLWAPSDRQ